MLEENTIHRKEQIHQISKSAWCCLIEICLWWLGTKEARNRSEGTRRNHHRFWEVQVCQQWPTGVGRRSISRGSSSRGVRRTRTWLRFAELGLANGYPRESSQTCSSRNRKQQRWRSCDMVLRQYGQTRDLRATSGQESWSKHRKWCASWVLSYDASNGFPRQKMHQSTQKLWHECRESNGLAFQPHGWPGFRRWLRDGQRREQDRAWRLQVRSPWSVQLVELHHPSRCISPCRSLCLPHQEVWRWWTKEMGLLQRC